MSEVYKADPALEKFSRPEDDLETPEIADLNRRSRAFAEEGGFRELLGVKIVIDDLLNASGLLNSGSIADHVQRVIDKPETYAHSVLDIREQTFAPEVQAQALKKYLAKTKQGEITMIDNYLKIITKFEIKTESGTLKELEKMLIRAKEEAWKDDWKSYGTTVLRAREHLYALNFFVKRCCGFPTEKDGTRAALGL